MTKLKYLNVLLTASLLADEINELNNTPLYKGKLKNLANNFKNELSFILDKDFNNVWSVDEMIMINLLKNKEALLKKIAKLNADDLLMYNQIIDNLDEKKENNNFYLEKIN